MNLGQAARTKLKRALHLQTFTPRQRVGAEYKKRNKHLQPLLDEVETDQASEEYSEIVDNNHGRESKFEKNDEHETFELKRKCSNSAYKPSRKI
ncbi:hypothetical protein TNCV_3783651 [Trichonephila clavipes]|nr:hypothetical protein TNCV_3783651 [Trichonephila clavipes]